MFRLVPLAFEYTSQKFQEKRSKYLYVNIFSNGKRKILRSFDNFLRLQRHDRYGEYVLHRCFHGSFIYLFFLLINQNERKVRGYDLTSLSPYRCKYFSTKLTIPRFYDLQTTLVVQRSGEVGWGGEGRGVGDRRRSTNYSRKIILLYSIFQQIIRINVRRLNIYISLSKYLKQNYYATFITIGLDFIIRIIILIVRHLIIYECLLSRIELLFISF